MIDKLELKSSHEVVYTVYVADVESIFYCKPDDPDILTVLMKDGKRLYCDEVCPVDFLQEESVSEVWHDASEEPDDMSHCLVYYGCKESVGHYLHYEPVLYNKKEKMFITSSFPHPTGYKVEQKSLDGGCVAEVYKDRRDRISISDITQWCYLYDLHNISNIEKTKNSEKKEPVSDDLEQAAEEYEEKGRIDSVVSRKRDFINGAKWQKEQDKETIELAEDHAMLAGMEKMKEQMMKDATEVTVHIEAGNYPYIPQLELYDYDKDVPLAKEGDKYKVVLIKEE